MSNLTTIGLVVLLFVVSGSVQKLGGDNSVGSYSPLVGLIGVITGANLIFLGVKMTGSSASVSLHAMASLATTCLRRNLTMVGLFTVSFALMVHVIVGPAIGLFLIFLLGVTMITVGVHGGLTSWTN